MDQLWIAVDEYFALPTSETSPESQFEREPVMADEYNQLLKKALDDVRDAQNSLDQANINIQDLKPQIQAALRRARGAMKKQPDTVTEPRIIFASVFRANIPTCSALFNALIRRKALSRVSINTPQFDANAMMQIR